MDFNAMRKEEMRTCARLAAEAFADYDYFRIYVPRDQRRRRFLDAMLKCEFRANVKLTEARFFTAKENGQILAVAQLCAPNYRKPSDVEYIRTGWLSVMLAGGFKPVNAWTAMEKEASAPCHALKPNTWYLSLLTVRVGSEGKGIGSRFMQECLIPYVKEQNAEALCLFTNSEQNRQFYLKNGFTEFDEKHFSYNGKTIGNWSYVMRFD